ncbi:MAG: GHKL domain-containing protein [Eubacteriales bacterium]|nr:GHKL domain-containing protein [Eubacteriales bacterium]
MWIALIDTALTFSSHAIAATHLAPLKHGKKWDYLFWIVWAALFTAFSTFAPSLRSGSPALSIAAFTLACLAHVALYFFTTTGSVGERFFLLLSYAAFFTACCAVAQLLQVFFLPENDWLYLLAYGTVLSAMLWIFLGQFLPVFRESARYVGQTWRILSLLMVLFTLALMTWFVFPSHITDFTFAQTTGLLILVLVMFTTYAVIFICIRNIAVAECAKQTEMRLELLITQVQAQAQATDEARRARHDLRHHNQTLLHLAEQNNTEEIVRYLRGVTALEKTAAMTWCENDTLNSILSVYAGKAAAAGVKTDILAQAESELPICPAELVTIVANLLENAVHGAAASAAAEPFVRLRVYPKADKLVVRVENTCKNKLNYPEGFPAEKYSVGLLSVQQAVTAHDGELFLTAQNGIFTVLVLLNLVP